MLLTLKISKTAKTSLWGVLVFLCLSSQLFAQYEDQTWLLGYRRMNTDPPDFSINRIDFAAYPPTINRFDSLYRFDMSASFVSDSTGSLLLYSNGVSIHDHQNRPVTGAESILSFTEFSGGLTVPQGTLLLPTPDKADSYWHFTEDDFFFFLPNQSLTRGFSPLYASKVIKDSNTDWRLTIQQIFHTTDTLANGQITAVRHGNGRDWWILIPTFLNHEYYLYLLNPEGFNEYGRQSFDLPVACGAGHAVFSSSGNLYARYEVGEAGRDLILFDFDRCSGTLSSPKQQFIPDSLAFGGVAFSPNSQYLYVSAYDRIVQYDVTQPDVWSTGVEVARYDGFLAQADNFEYPTRFFNMQLAPDGRIWVSVPNFASQYMHVIQYPNRRGVACGVRQHEIELPGFSAFTIPNVPNYRLGAERGSTCDTLNRAYPPIANFRYDIDPDDSLLVYFSDLSAYQVDNWNWTFGGEGDSDESCPGFRFSSASPYEVCLEVNNEDGYDRICQIINLGNNILPLSVQLDSLKDSDCFGDSSGTLVIGINGGLPPYRIEWNTGDTTTGLLNLSNGVYTVQVRDQDTSIIEVQWSIEEPDSLALDEVELIDATCTTCPDGQIRVSLTGGTPPYDYEWSTGDTSQLLTNLQPGVYTLKVIDTEGCEWEQSFRIDFSTSVNEVNQQMIQVYPNPAQERIMVVTLPSTFLPTDRVSIELFDASGRSVWTQQYNAQALYEIAIDQFSNGLYFINLSTDREGVVYTSKVTILR